MYGHAQIDEELIIFFKLRFQEINLNIIIDDMSRYYAIKFGIKWLKEFKVRHLFRTSKRLKERSVLSSSVITIYKLDEL